MQFDKGFLSPYFITDPQTMKCVLEDALILIHEKKISNLRELLPAAREARHRRRKPLLIIAEDVEGEALAALWSTACGESCRSAPSRPPAFGDRRKAILQDIAVLTGGTFVSQDLGINLENLELAQLGTRQAHSDRQGHDDDRRGRRQVLGHQGADRPHPARHRDDDQRLRQGKARGAAGEALGRRRRRQGRRLHRNRSQGEEGPRRRRAPRDARGSRRRHRAGRRRRRPAGPGRGR